MTVSAGGAAWQRPCRDMRLIAGTQTAQSKLPDTLWQVHERLRVHADVTGPMHLRPRCTQPSQTAMPVTFCSHNL